jgi:hypothetical protein
MYGPANAHYGRQQLPLSFCPSVATMTLAPSAAPRGGGLCHNYLKAVDEVDFDVAYAMLNKIFARDTYTGPARYSPPVVVGIQTQVIRGNPDPAHISTSFAEWPDRAFLDQAV